MVQSEKFGFIWGLIMPLSSWHHEITPYTGNPFVPTRISRERTEVFVDGSFEQW